MHNVLDDNEIHDDVEVAIEYQIPRTSKRVDFIICGSDNNNKNNVIVVELKQCLKDMKKRTLIIQGGPGTGVPINTA